MLDFLHRQYSPLIVLMNNCIVGKEKDMASSVLYNTAITAKWLLHN